MLILKILGLTCIIFMSRFLERLKRENELFWAYAFYVRLFFMSIQHQIIENFVVRESEIANLIIRVDGTSGNQGNFVPLLETTISNQKALAVFGGDSLPGLFSAKREKFDLVLHARLMKTFPDWPARMDYQKKQEEFYKSAIKKQIQLKRLRIKNTSGSIGRVTGDR